MGKRIIEELATDTIQDNDFILMDNNTTPTGPDDDEAGTRKIRASEFGAQIITVDDELSDSSENPVQNKVITGAINTLASATEITGTSSGSIATFDDGSALPLKDLDVSIAAIQDLHGYDNPWVGGGGKNKFDSSVLEENSSWTTATLSIGVGTWTMSTTKGSSSDTNLFLYFRKTGDTSQGTANAVSNTHSVTLTLAENETAEVVFRRSDGTDLFSNYRYQIESGNQATTYQPYANICPISGWTACNVSVCGVNLNPNSGINHTTSNGIRFYVKAGEYVFSPNLSVNILANESAYMSLFDAKTDGNNITNGNISSTRLILNGTGTKYYSSSNIPNIPFTVLKDGWLAIGFDNQKPTNYTSYQVEIGSSPTTYKAYSGNTYTIQFTDGDNPLTVYGGTLDVTNGVLTVDRVTSSGKITALGTVQTYENITYGRFEKPSNSKNRGDTSVHNLISNMYPVDSATYNWDDVNKIGKMFVGADYNNFWIGFPHGTTLTEMQTITNDNIICYELATPQTYSLTPTMIQSILGRNNVSVDTGNVLACEYVKDTDIVIKKLLYKDLTATLSANATSLTITDSAITTDATYDIFTDTYGVNPTAVSVSNGSMTLTFTARSSATKVKVRVML